MTDAATIAYFTPPEHFMCCICFEFFPNSEAYVDPEGERWNVCPTDVDKM